MADRRLDDLLTAPRGLQLLELVSQRGPTHLTAEDLAMVEALVSRYQGDYDAHITALKSRAPALRSLAEALQPRIADWWQHLDRPHQIWVGRSADAPSENRLIVDLTRLGAEAPKPRRALWTSTLVAGAISPWLLWPERQSSDPFYTWELSVSASARVLEIDSRDSWSEFARRYPMAETGYTYTPSPPRPQSAARLDPDWQEVARDWDGVHLSTGGWLTAEDVPYESGGVTTELRSWNMESTVWLRWSFTSAARFEV